MVLGSREHDETNEWDVAERVREREEEKERKTEQCTTKGGPDAREGKGRHKDKEDKGEDGRAINTGVPHNPNHTHTVCITRLAIQRSDRSVLFFLRVFTFSGSFLSRKQQLVSLNTHGKGVACIWVIPLVLCVHPAVKLFSATLNEQTRHAFVFLGDGASVSLLFAWTMRAPGYRNAPSFSLHTGN